MKKLLGILVLGLLWCNVGFGDELIKIPVHVHILEIDEEGFKTKTEPDDVEMDFKKANEIWAQANIFWDLKKIDYVPADTTDFKSRMKWLTSGKEDRSGREWAIYEELIQVEKHQKEGAMDVYYMPTYVLKKKERDYGIPFIFKKPFPRKEFVIIGHNKNPKLKDAGTRREKILAHMLGHLLYLKHDWKEEFLMFGIPPGKKMSKKKLKNFKRGTKIPEYTAKNARENYHKHLKRFLD